MSNTTISRQFVNDLQATLEDMVEYSIREAMENGELVSGESVYKIIEALAVAKQAEFRGEFN